MTVVLVELLSYCSVPVMTDSYDDIITTLS